jgi:hypothetical protein
MATSPKHSPHFLAREPDGSVRLRMRFTAEEAALFEEAAGGMPVVDWLHYSLNSAAKKAVRRPREERKHLPPPE